jgi:hypothetical protein
MGEPQKGSGSFGNENNLLQLPEFEPGIFQRVAESLYRLLYAGSNITTVTYVIKSEMET